MAASGVLQAQTLEERLAACTECHGPKTLPTNPQAPIVWGQHAGYLYLQLRDFKNGDRQHEFMNIFAATLQKQELLVIAEYIGAQQWPKTGYRSEDEESAARRALAAGMCAECHFGSYAGDGTMPRLAGQTVVYLEKTMLDFKTGARANNAAKTSLMATFSEEEIRAMAIYLAGL